MCLKNIRKFLVIIFIIIPLAGCAGYSVKSYTGPTLDDSEVSTITTDHPEITIGRVDTERTLKFSNPVHWFYMLLLGRFPTTVSVLPGDHTFMICYQPGYLTMCEKNGIRIKTEPGKVYIVNHERPAFGPDPIKFWIGKPDHYEENAVIYNK